MSDDAWTHGDVSDAELRARGLQPEACLDFAVNVDPQGPHAAVLEAARACPIHRYPDPRCRELRDALARRDDVDPASLVVAAGATGALWAMMLSLRHRGRVLLRPPTFSEYGRAAAMAGLEIVARRGEPERGFAFDPEALEDDLRRHPQGVVVLGSPENPTGRGLDYAWIAELARRHPAAIVVLDEAFLRLSDDHARTREPLPTTVWRLRSVTKELGMPGLRVGYLIAPPRDAERIEQQIPPWTVSSVAQAAARAGVEDPTIVAEARRRMRADTEALRAELRGLGLRPLPTRTVYTLVEVGPATAIRTRLLAQGILVRDASSFGLPRHLRLCGRPQADRLRLLAALEAVLRR